MSKKIQLSIAEPCHENWENMSPVDKGKFCGSCQKQVVDFSNMSDRQVAEFFKKPSTGSVCGRFMTDQLERDIEIPRKRIPWVKYFFQIAIPAFLFSIKGSAQKTQGKIKMNTVTKDTARKSVYDNIRMMGMVARPLDIKPFMGDTIVTPVKEPVQTLKGEIAIKTPTTEPVCSREIMGKVSAPLQTPRVDTLKITGRITDQNGGSVSNATVVIKGTRNGVVTNVNGEFSITPKSGWEKVVLVNSSVGFITNETLVDRNNYSGNVVINIEPVKLNYQMMGDVVVLRCYSKKSVKPIPIIPETVQATTTRSFKIFPNPVSSGSNVAIEWKQAEEGYYALQLLNQSGQSLQKQEIRIDTETRLLNINVPVVAAGSYYMVLTNKKTGKKFTEKIIIQ